MILPIISTMMIKCNEVMKVELFFSHNFYNMTTPPICSDVLRYIACFVGDLKWSSVCKQWQESLSLTRVKETGGLDTVHVVFYTFINNKAFHSIIGPRTRHLNYILQWYPILQFTDLNLVSLTLDGFGVNIIELPAFPPTLQKLRLETFQHLRRIPKLPPTLQDMVIDEFPLVEVIPELPRTLYSLGLINLSAITVIPELPPALNKILVLYELSCIKVIPKLPPALKTLLLFGLPCVRVIPELPQTLQNLSIWSSPLIQIIPDIPLGLQELELHDLLSVEAIPELPKSLKKASLIQLPAVMVKPNLPSFVYWSV
jgi:hypothetical protein